MTETAPKFAYLDELDDSDYEDDEYEYEESSSSDDDESLKSAAVTTTTCPSRDEAKCAYSPIDPEYFDDELSCNKDDESKCAATMAWTLPPPMTKLPPALPPDHPFTMMKMPALPPDPLKMLFDGPDPLMMDPFMMMLRAKKAPDRDMTDCTQERCAQCQKESHSPVSCEMAAQWVNAPGVAILVVDPNYVEACMQRCIQECANQLSLSTSAAIRRLCDNQWNLQQLAAETVPRRTPTPLGRRMARHRGLDRYREHEERIARLFELTRRDRRHPFELWTDRMDVAMERQELPGSTPPPREAPTSGSLLVQAESKTASTPPRVPRGTPKVESTPASMPPWLTPPRETIFGTPKVEPPLASVPPRETPQRETQEETSATPKVESKPPLASTPPRETPWPPRETTPGTSSGNVEPKSPPPAVETKQAIEHACMICLEDDVEETDMLSLSCGHKYCRTCWRQFIETMLNGNQALTTTCPFVGCNEKVTQELIQEIVPEQMPVFEKHLLFSFVKANYETMRWCPGPDCEGVAVRAREGLFTENMRDMSMTTCKSCTTRFDFDEQAQAMPPYAMLSGKNPVKKCPQCDIPVEKIGGCNRMTCKCSHHFCWLCLSDMNDGYSHRCRFDGDTIGRRVRQGRFDLEYLCETIQQDDKEPDEQARALLQKKKDMDQFAHYYNRYLTHNQGQRFAGWKKGPGLQRRAKNYMESSGFETGTDADFIEAANEMLVASRRLLKYTYCYSYHMAINSSDADQTQLGLFQNHQERLERFTEELSELSENPLTREDRSRMIDLIPIVGRCMEIVAGYELEQSHDPETELQL